jgi:aspartyl-tRNA(Asn)/glutamyl-tRNA(Gln) amidotransferase subunit A
MAVSKNPKHRDATRRSFLQAGSAAFAMAASGFAAAGKTMSEKSPSCRDRLDQALQRIADPSGEGSRTYLTLYSKQAVIAADLADRRARNGESLGPLDGVIVSIKDLFDVAGEPTRAGSKVLANAPPALVDAPVVQRLRRAGAVIIGKTNMSEFAFSGVGTNSHYGTPGNPADRTRIPGGSTSGGAVAVADRMCAIAIGTDTGGSTRIPAALCGIVGFKPTKSRVPTEGAFPLSPTLDSVGPMAGTVEDCACADSILSGEQPSILEPASLKGLRFGIPQGLPLRELDDTVTSAFADGIAILDRAGVRLSQPGFALFDDMARVSAPPLAVVESWAIHGDRLATQGDDYDPFVRNRIELGEGVSSADRTKMLEARTSLVRAMDERLSEVDALVLPTAPIVAPTIAEVSTPEGFTARNRLLLRNTGIANFFDLCAISLPLPRRGLPTGLMLIARHGADRRLLAMALSVQRLLAA